jgi:hypothetical protein
MITNFIELYSELEFLKNKAIQTQYEISQIKRITPKVNNYIIGLLNSLLNEWDLSSLKHIKLTFNPDLVRNMNYIKDAFRSLLTYYYRLIDEVQHPKELIPEIQHAITDIVESINEIQKIIYGFEHDFIFSNVVIREQLDDLITRFMALIRSITPTSVQTSTFKDETTVIKLPDIYREDIIDFMTDFMRFVNHFGIPVEHETIRMLYEPLFTKQTITDYKQKLKEFENFIYSIIVQIKEKITNST